MNAAPAPGPSLAADTTPPWSSTRSAHDRQAEPEAALGRSAVRAAWHEQIEQPRQQLRIDADAVVAHDERTHSPSRRRRRAILPPRGVYFAAFDEQIRDHLHEAHRVGVDR